MLLPSHCLCNTDYSKTSHMKRNPVAGRVINFHYKLFIQYSLVWKRCFREMKQFMSHPDGFVSLRKERKMANKTVLFFFLSFLCHTFNIPDFSLFSFLPPFILAVSEIVLLPFSGQQPIHHLL